jgi:Tol biopolymer transport system component/predicted Ser/Thr protein kinase
MPLTVGTKLAWYEIVAPIGAGGMGEVYRARDTKLDRDVAIKVLPAVLAEDPERLARFEREAKVLASLNHPNIAQIYGVEERALVMELVAGETLEGPLPLDTTLNYARQIADALEAAHDKGIIHRDLKPANIMITPAGVVKVLDFGLAAVAQSSDPSNPANSPTLTISPTRAGMILGTAGYMSPEQARGKTVDKRADIWAFGVVLFEMLTGKPLFAGETVSDTLAHVLTKQPDWEQVPAKVRRLLEACLQKDPRQRLQAIGDWRLMLADDAAIVTAPSRSRLGWLAWGIAALFLLTTLAVSFVHFREKPPVAELLRFQIPAPEKVTLGNELSLSPDGRRLAFTARGANGVTQIWVRSFDTLEARPLPGTEGADGLFWSPDSRFIGFGTVSKLKKVDALGGPVQSVCDLSGTFLGGAWAPDGTIIVGGLFRPVMRVPEAGGTPAPITALDPARQEAYQGNPSFLPDGRHFVYARGSLGNGGIYLGSLDAKPEQQDSKQLATSQYPAPVYARSHDPALGYVLFEQEGSLMALPFDARRLAPAGAAVPIAESIVSGGTVGGASYSASATGVLAFRTGRSGGSDTQLLWFDRQGKQLGQIGPPAPYGDIQLSPDGKLVLVDQSLQHLWFADPARGVFSRVNPGDIQEYSSAISPDGRVAFTYGPGGVLGDIYVKLANGAGAPELLVKSATMKHPNHWSLDGRYLIYDDHTKQHQDLWIVPMSGGKTGDHKPIPFLVTPADETFGQFSPDTRWIAYSSDESGRREVYVQGFVPDHVPAAGVGKWQISTAGGDKPRWRRDGKELYYIAPDGKMMAVPIKSTATTFEPGVAIPLFETHVISFVPYDVAPDGRFLLNTVKEDPAANTSPITVVLNWTTGLKK